MGRLTLLPSEVKSSPDALAGFSNIPFGPALIIPFNHQDGIPNSLCSVIQELSHEVKVISFTVLRSLDLQVLENLASHVLQLQSRHSLYVTSSISYIRPLNHWKTNGYPHVFSVKRRKSTMFCVRKCPCFG